MYVATNSRAQEATREALGEYNDCQYGTGGGRSNAHLDAYHELTRVASKLNSSSEDEVVFCGNGEVIDLTGDVGKIRMQSVTSTTKSPVRSTTSPFSRLITSAS